MKERRLHRSGSQFEREIGFARAVRIGGVIEVSGTAPIGDDGQTVGDNAYEQTRRCFEIAVEALRALGSAPIDVVRTRMYLVDAADWPEVGRAHRELFADIAPVATMVVVKELLDPAWRVEIELQARV